MYEYNVNFKLKQLKEKTAWIEYILQSGLIEGEAIENYHIEALTEVMNNSKKINQYNGSF
jgi:uncharacterized protein YfkK (UPF0435 family)